MRLQEKAARRVAYNSPLEQTIITNKYTKSHIDLLIEDASPESPASGIGGDPNSDTVLDLALAFTGDETKDGGQTPGPFEEMRRRMAGLAAATPNSPSGYGGIRKKRRKEKKRRWVWTIGKEEEEENEEDVAGAMAATRAVNARAASEPPQTTSPLQARISTLEQIPTPSVESVEDCGDVEMLDAGSDSKCGGRASMLDEMESDLRTPTLMRDPIEGEASAKTYECDQLGSTELFNPETGSRRDTPVPPDMVSSPS